MTVETKIHRKFCKNLRARRLELNLTQQEVADLLEISQPAYAQLESGRRVPSIESADRAARVLKTTAVELLE